MITNKYARIQAFIMCLDPPESDSRQANTETPESGQAEFVQLRDDTSSQANTEESSKPVMSKFVVRMPADLLEKLKHVSRHHKRSMNTEINLLLGRYIEQVKGESRPGVDEHLRLDSQLLSKLRALPAQKIDALLDLLD